MSRRSDAALKEDRFRATLIAALYRLALNRAVDASGLASAMRGLRQNMPFSAIVAGTLRSDEFARLHSAAVLTADDIDRLFRSAFGRPPMVLDPALRALPADAYAAQLLTAEERRAPNRVTSMICPDGIDLNDEQAYRFWIEDHCVPDEQTRAVIRAAAASLPSGIAVSLVMLAGSAGGRAMAAALDTVRSQLCDRFELIIVGGPGPCAAALRDNPGAIPVVLETHDFTAAFNAALVRCRGAFVWVLDPAVRLAPDAVFHIALAQANDHDQRTAALVSDHDSIDHEGRRFAPSFRTGWDADAALSRGDWARHMLLRTAHARAAGGARRGHAGREQDDLALRVVRSAGPDRVRHVPRVLFSLAAGRPWIGWMRVAGTAWVRERSWLRLINEHLARSAGAGEQPPRAVATGGFAPARVIYPLPRAKPLVSIIIPTRDRVDLLRVCMDGLLRRTDYGPLEILVIDNRSEDPLTHAYLAELSAFQTVRVLRFDGDFNWGAINNRGVLASRGDVVLLLNNDTEVIQPDWLTEMATQAMRPEVGVVGAKLLYRNGTVQHAGLVLGPDAHAFHRYRHMPGTARGYRDELAKVRNVSAVTGACLALRRAVFDEVGGIEERALAVTWSDVDLCFRVRERGYRVICTPFARMLHVELATRGADSTPERADRAERERQFMLRRWPALAREDPFFSPNFRLAEGDTRLAAPPRPRDALASWEPGQSATLSADIPADVSPTPR
jgi:GT2 family glycosyltransferase